MNERYPKYFLLIAANHTPKRPTNPLLPSHEDRVKNANKTPMIKTK
ncbi:hypothetical protein ID0462_03050 [Helicobacter pylori]